MLRLPETSCPSPGLTVLLLGAGFSRVAGSPLASELFDADLFGGANWREEVIGSVLDRWSRWRQDHPDEHAEAFVTHAYRQVYGWSDLVKYLGLVLAQDFVSWRAYGGRLKAEKHSLVSAQIPPGHEVFWSNIFRRYPERSVSAVITTNFDIWIERGMRYRTTPRRKRFGFNYGIVGERLRGQPGFPRTEALNPTYVTGAIPLLKLHGSISWAVEQGKLVKYTDCRPAMRGDAAIVPPVHEKEIPSWLRSVWDEAHAALSAAEHLVVVGYSLPEYDTEIRRLLASCAGPRKLAVDVFDLYPDPIVTRLSGLLPQAEVRPHGPIPETCAELGPLL